MAGKFLKREGLDGHPIRFTVCGCPDPNSGGWHTIDLEHQVPSAEDCAEIIRAHNAAGKTDKN
jgi:hypothetical protein